MLYENPIRKAYSDLFKCFILSNTTIPSLKSSRKVFCLLFKHKVLNSIPEPHHSSTALKGLTTYNLDTSVQPATYICTKKQKKELGEKGINTSPCSCQLLAVARNTNSLQACRDLSLASGLWRKGHIVSQCALYECKPSSAV